MYALPCSDHLTDVPQDCVRQRPQPAKPRGGTAAPSRSMLRASYAELHRLSVELLRPRSMSRSIDPRTLVNEAARHTLGTSGLQDLADPGGYLAFLACALRTMLSDLVRESHDRGRQSPEVWFYVPGVSGGTDACTLLEALDRLERRSPRHAQIAVLRVFGGLSDAEVASQLGIDATRARVGWSRASEWLRLACSAPRR